MKSEVKLAKAHAHIKVLARFVEDALRADSPQMKDEIYEAFQRFQKEANTQRYGLYREYYLLGYGSWFEMLYDGYLFLGNLYKKLCKIRFS